MKALILEDEDIIARVLQNKIRQAAPEIDIIDVLPSLKTARRWFLQNAEPDLIFMDVQLSDGMSFDLFKQYRLKCPVIFTTAFDEYAVRAFKVNGVDYLLKPVYGDELKKAIDKARSSVDKKSSSAVDLEELVRSLANPQGGSRYK
jgi:two-component SAPR family response regulator